MSFQNINQCRSYKQTITTALVALTAQPCTEVIVYNISGTTIEIFDSNFGPSEGPFSFTLKDGDSFVVRGLTNSNQVSARTTSGSGAICYRTQFFSNFTQGV